MSLKFMWCCIDLVIILGFLIDHLFISFDMINFTLNLISDNAHLLIYQVFRFFIVRLLNLSFNLSNLSLKFKFLLDELSLLLIFFFLLFDWLFSYINLFLLNIFFSHVFLIHLLSFRYFFFIFILIFNFLCLRLLDDIVILSISEQKLTIFILLGLRIDFLFHLWLSL